MSEVKIHRSTKTPVIEFSDAAKTYLLASLAKVPLAIGIRFSVKKAGCSGFSYVLEYVDTEGKNDISFPLSEHHLTFVDQDSLIFIQGMKVDYLKEGLGSKLVFLNPNQKGQCGCGESFTV